MDREEMDFFELDESQTVCYSIFSERIYQKWS